uniref:winged helix-turn-helix domain-containing protein n=1 Tax=Faecalibacterium sp. TaxID=1971605 RepID=UPI0040285679
IVTSEALCEALWGADYYRYQKSLCVHIRHLREKLEPEPGRPRFLQTVRGIGYKLAKEDAR